jgi:(p)ppGpp synthase/HD superfamily hydrolase
LPDVAEYSSILYSTAFVFANPDYMSSVWSQSAYQKGLLFAAQAHQGQLYPGTQISYVIHLAYVSMEVIAALAIEGGRRGDLAVQCSLLHDVLEDTPTTEAELSAAFGTEVTAGVRALTKDSRLDKSQQMTDSLQRIVEQPPEVGMVKLADRISNLSSPPGHWSQDKIRKYREEAVLIHETLHQASTYLAARLHQKIVEYGQHLEG